MIHADLDRAVSHMGRQAGALASAQRAADARDFAAMASDLRAAARAAMASADCLLAAARAAVNDAPADAG